MHFVTCSLTTPKLEGYNILELTRFDDTREFVSLTFLKLILWGVATLPKLEYYFLCHMKDVLILSKIWMYLDKLIQVS
jgi:hypothetical protein